MFKSVKDNWRKAEAAVVLEKLFENQHMIFDGNPKLQAGAIVQKCWDRGSAALDGSKGPRPHRVAIAAISLAHAIKFETGTAEDKLYLVLSLRELLEGVHSLKSSNEFNLVDEKLFDMATEAYDFFFDTADEMQTTKIDEAP